MRIVIRIFAYCLALAGLVLLSRPGPLTPSPAPSPPAPVAHGAPTAEGEGVGGEGDVAPAIDAIVQDALKTWQVPGLAVAVVRDDKIIYLKGAGLRELGKDDPVTPDTLFPIASCTKGFTTTAMAMLVDEGKMRWDDPVRKHVEFFRLADPLANEQVTLRDLVSHRTGLGSNDFLWYHSPWTRDEVIRKIGLVKPKHTFRSKFEYQSTMFSAAGVAVEKSAGAPWEAFVQQRINTPLGMSGIVFTTPAALKAPDHASPHRKDPQGNVQVIPWYSFEKPEPAGSICASARDLSRWLRFQLGDGTFEGKRLVSAVNLAETHSPQTIIRLRGEARAMNPDTIQMSYGMAWVIQDYRGHPLVSHAGAIDGFRVHLTLVPIEKIGIVLLNNLDRSSMNLAVSNQIVDRLLGLPGKDWNAYIGEQLQKNEAAAQAELREWQAKRRPDLKPSRPLAAYAGTYEDPAYGSVNLSLNDGVLIWKWNRFTGPLEHYQSDTFVLQNQVLGFPQVVFTLNADGETASMKISHPLEVEFKKGKP